NKWTQGPLDLQASSLDLVRLRAMDLIITTILSVYRAPTVFRKIFHNVLLKKTSSCVSRSRLMAACWKIGFNLRKRNGAPSAIATLAGNRYVVGGETGKISLMMSMQPKHRTPWPRQRSLPVKPQHAVSIHQERKGQPPLLSPASCAI